MEFPVQGHSVVVTCLPIHLEGQQPVYFKPGEDLSTRPAAQSKLMAYFHFTETHPEFQDICYVDILKVSSKLANNRAQVITFPFSQYATWQTGKLQDGSTLHYWRPRTRGTRVKKRSDGETVDPKGRSYKLSFGRLPNITWTYRTEEIHFLRTLLTFKPATSFGHLGLPREV